MAQVEDNVVGTNEIFGAGIFSLISLIILLSINAKFTILVFLPLVAIAVAIQYAETRIKRYRFASRQATQQVSGLIGEMFTAIQAIQVAGAEVSILNQLDHLNDRRRQSMVQDRVFTAVISSSLENLVSLGTGLILLVAAQSRYSSGDRALSVGDFALFVYYLAFVTDFLSFLGGFLALTKQTEVAFERMGTLVKQNKEVESEKDPAEKIIAYAPLYLANLRGEVTNLPTIAQPNRATYLQNLNAVDLTYPYPGSDRGITDINLTLQRGSLTVITGQVGSGKTTLLQVLLRLLPMQSGEIYWNGSLIKRPDLFFVPPRSAYTPQVPQLFSNTLRENLLLGLQKREEELKEAIATAALDQDVAAMPERLDTFIGAKGMRLSGGQLHRTAAARMLIRQPELLVFDDLSSALDLETEQKLWSCLFEIERLSPLVQSLAHSPLHIYNPTCLAVSHRPFLLRQADRVIVLRNGRVETEGKLEDLNLI